MKKRITLQVALLTAMFALSVSTVAPVNGAAFGNDELLDAFDVALTNIIESGDYDTIFEAWFDGEVVLVDDTTTSTATEFPEATKGGTLADILDAGEIVFGSDTAYPPFESIDASGDVVGFDADIAAAIATEFSTAYGITVVGTMQTAEWTPIKENLIAGEYDAILSAMTKTAERALVVDFTRAYYTSSQGILRGTLDSSIIIDDVEDLWNDTTIKVALQQDTTSDLYAQEFFEDYATRVSGFATIDLALAALLAEDVHVVVGDTPVLKFYETDNTGTSELVATFSDENFGLAVRPNTGTAPADAGVIKPVGDSDDDGLPFPFIPLLAAFMAIPLIRRFRKFLCIKI
ncbi:MAG: ABC transporter arginine-binding protein precursor [Candidatus Heimdallarchaeota archaeon LC_2]|nr:MAG: ABC transporter arginine-binding protein precursor [Candidatus Heimdallarchaeota archaeon LC_2]